MKIAFSVWCFCALLVGAVTFGDQLVGRDGDLFTHVAYGRHILQHGMGAPDSTIYTTTQAPVLHEWLAEVVLALGVQWFGLGAPLLVGSFVWALVPSYTFVAQVRRRGFWPALLAACMTLIGLGSAFTLRPHLLSWVLFLVSIHFLPARRRTWPLLLSIGVLWVNVHGGSSVLLPLTALAFIVGDLVAHRRWSWFDAGLWVALVAILNVNPDGARLWVHLFDFMLLGDLNQAQDMKPPDFVTGTAVTFIVLTVYLLLGLKNGGGWPGRLLMIGVWLMSCTASRHLPFLGIGVALFATAGVADRLRFAAESSARLASEIEFGRNRSLLLPCVAVLVAAVWRVASPPVPVGPSVPAAAMEWFRSHPDLARERGYAGYNYAGYLYVNTPVTSLYLHGVNANIPLHLMQDLHVLMGGGAEAMKLLDLHAVRWIVVHRGEPLARTLEAEGWAEQLHVASDDAELFLRP